MKRYLWIIPCVAVLGACSSSGPKRVTIESSLDKPSWIESNKLSWEKDGFVFYRSQQTVRGDQRVNGCYDLAALDAREHLLKGMADEMKGAIDNAQTDISENAELILGKVRSGKWEGRILGMQDEERYFERYQIRDEQAHEKIERIDCHVLSKISKADYNQTKQSVVNKMVAVDPRIKEAITKKQVDFFTESKPEGQRNPASEEKADSQ
jgi:hypothetical protein